MPSLFRAKFHKNRHWMLPWNKWLFCLLMLLKYNLSNQDTFKKFYFYIKNQLILSDDHKVIWRKSKGLKPKVVPAIFFPEFGHDFFDSGSSSVATKPKISDCINKKLTKTIIKLNKAKPQNKWVFYNIVSAFHNRANITWTLLKKKKNVIHKPFLSDLISKTNGSRGPSLPFPKPSPGVQPIFCINFKPTPLLIAFVCFKKS